MAEAAQGLNLLVVHSSAELYGSDRSLLDFVKARPATWKLTVVLPEPGPLVTALANAGAEVLVGEVCKLQRGMLSPGGLYRTLTSAWRSTRTLRILHRRRGFDLVYSNSVAVVGGALCAWRCGLPHVWHVREILAGSGALTAAFRWLVRHLSSSVICNSDQTLAWIAGPQGAGDARYLAIWNGYDRPALPAVTEDVRQSLGAGEHDVLVVMVGRINAWKGQGLLVQAFAEAVAGSHMSLKLALVGSPFAGQEHFESELRSAVAASGCAERITLMPFRTDIEQVWAVADIAVVPSTEPEPFGRVAVEAMAFGKPVIAAAHGGLTEIVENGTTGLLVPPRDSAALAKALQQLGGDAAMRRRMGAAGLGRQLKHFSVQGYADRVAAALRGARDSSSNGVAA